MIKQEKIGSKVVYVAEFGTGDIAIIPAATSWAPGRPVGADNMIWLVQDEPKPESEWENDPVAGIKNTDEVNGEPMPIVLRFSSAKSALILAGSINAIAHEMQQYEEQRIIKLKALLEIKTISESGYAGTLSTGEIVDRRDYPDAIPIQANPMFNIPAPLPLPGPSNKGAIL